MSRELILIPKEKYERMLYNYTQKLEIDDGDTNKQQDKSDNTSNAKHVETGVVNDKSVHFDLTEKQAMRDMMNDTSHTDNVQAEVINSENGNRPLTDDNTQSELAGGSIISDKQMSFRVETTPLHFYKWTRKRPMRKKWHTFRV